jgi:hypothetical protein
VVNKGAQLNFIRYLAAVAFSLFSSFGYSWSWPAIPAGWRAPTVLETAYDIPIRESDPNRYLFTEADFNGDGEVDVARILVNDKMNKLALFVFLSSDSASEALLLTELDDTSSARRMGVSKLEAGVYPTACAKGYGLPCKEGEPSLISLRNPAINFFVLESASSAFVWDASSRSFTLIWMSD